MEPSIFFAKLFGLYFIIVGLIFLFRRKAIREVVAGLNENRVLLTLIALLEIVAGLALALTHSIFTSDYRMIISVVAYLMIVEGILYILLPARTLRKFLNFFNKPTFYTLGSIFAILVGLFLACKGYGWWS